MKNAKETEELAIIAKANAAIAAAEAAHLEAAYTRAAEAEKTKQLEETETSKETEEILEFIESYRRRVRDMLDLNSDGQEEDSDYKPHERA